MKRVSAAEINTRTKHVNQFESNRVEGEDVRVTGRGEGTLLPPLSMSQVEDVDAEREEEEALSDDVSSGDINRSQRV